MSGLLGKKIGCTHIFDEQGNMVPVTALEAGPCVVLGVGDKNVQLGFEAVKEQKVKKPQLGLFKKTKTAPKRFIKELKKSQAREYKVGDDLKVDIFKAGEYVDITGTSKGKGFQGGVKRWHWSGGPKSHGSMSHRRVGSIGASADPSRVFKGQHMPGHMGNVTVTVQHLKVAGVDAENNLLMVKGAVPGAKDGYLVIRKSPRKAHLVPKEEQKPAEKEEKKEAKKEEKKQ